jgi:hypothetical protein
MITTNTYNQILRHAWPEHHCVSSGPFIVDCTIPSISTESELNRALANLLQAFASLNFEFNGNSPGESTGRERYLERDLVYSISEITRMLQECQCPNLSLSDAAKRAEWLISAAWNAILAGDIHDVVQHAFDQEGERNC